uniref:Putative secretory peptide-49 n=1 Tax=Pleurobrachia bachei TaxID=34499 RepID=M4H2I7_PLEBA|nr:putative secretory peptide-49 [Pleurobrachia bachei]|eukprot:sb/3472641/
MFLNRLLPLLLLLSAAFADFRFDALFPTANPPPPAPPLTHNPPSLSLDDLELPSKLKEDEESSYRVKRDFLVQKRSELGKNECYKRVEQLEVVKKSSDTARQVRALKVARCSNADGSDSACGRLKRSEDSVELDYVRVQRDVVECCTGWERNDDAKCLVRKSS